MFETIPATDPTFGHLTNKGRKHIACLRRRADHLAGRIEANVVRDLTFDRQELSAIKWALALLANVGKEQNGDGMV